MPGLNISSSVIPVMNLQGGTRNERSITGALLSSKNNAEVNLAKVSHQDTPHTQDAAYRDLAKQACREILGDKANIVLRDTTNHGARLTQHAINLLVLKNEVGSGEGGSLTNAVQQLNSAVESYRDYGEKGYSSTCNVGSSSAYQANFEIEKAIDELVNEQRGVFDTAAGLMHEMYLREGLAKAQGLSLGLSLNEQSAVNSSFCGNATEVANSHLVSQLDGHMQKGGGTGLARFVKAMLSQLDLGRDPVADRSKQLKEPTARARSEGGDVGRLARDISQRGGGARVGDIIVKPDASSGGEGALLKALDIIGEQSRFLQNRVVDLERELLRVSNPNQNHVSTDLSSHGSQILGMGSHTSPKRAITAQVEGVAIDNLLSSAASSEILDKVETSPSDTEADDKSEDGGKADLVLEDVSIDRVKYSVVPAPRVYLSAGSSSYVSGASRWGKG
ncbi:hypothetical protein ACIP1G_12790 [Pseudomonas sp. NPDC089392]|uniref:hypothetical protein n=1 Tax=Pseudomonas sp. NPDC089392 TaxID=3364459 RepID=UPI00382EBD8B